LRAPGKKTRQKIAPSAISARLNPRVTLETLADGNIVARAGGLPLGLGKFSAGAAKTAQGLSQGLRFSSFESGGNAAGEIKLLVERLARRGLLEYSLGHSGGGRDLVVIEPQIPDYWPRTAKLGASDTIVLSRFAYLRRRGNEMVLESPRAGALFRICDPAFAAILTALSTPQKVSKLRRMEGFPGTELLALLLDCQILFRVDAAGGDGLRPAEGDDNLVMWDFHDLLFHTHSTEGRQANPLGGLYPYAGIIPPPPAVRPRWPGRKIDLRKFSTAPAEADSSFAKLLLERHSTRDFDDQQPIALAELARFLDSTARVQARWRSRLDPGTGGPMVAYTRRPYPSAGSDYELELYLAVANCAGLARGFYHYDADRHALAPIGVRTQEFDALLTGAQFAMDAPGAPQILIVIAARFGRISWKYSGIAYSLILKDVGVLIQTLYLMATDMGLGGCAIGTSNIDLFAKLTGIEFHVEGPVGQFAIGRGAKPDASDEQTRL
jgi:SagB-type dehydrogenase family enzyme